MTGMSALITAIAGSIGGGGARFIDPNRFPKMVGLGNDIDDGINIFRAHFAGEADFWTYWAQRGVAVDSNNTANTYKTLLSASGRGIVYGAISQAISSGSDTVSFRFTVDGGTPVVVAFAPGTINYRLFLGWPAFSTWFTTASNSSGSMVEASFDATKTVLNAAGGSDWEIMDPMMLDLFGCGLAFSSSMLVEVKATSTQNSAGLMEREAGVLYRMGI